MAAPSPFIPESERTPVLVTHLSPLLGFVLPGIGALLGPVAAWLYYRDRSRLLDEQGKEAVNFQISMWIYSTVIGLVAFGLFSLGLIGGAVGSAAGQPGVGAFAVLGLFSTFFLFFLPVLLVLGLLPLILMLVAVIQVSAGKPYRYPLTLRLLR
ncbi:hypothetical protein GCM10008955_02430 [Deinococcus malanensis]|uniref:DUF4870 domain-containing protein n=1 Tax=Deinococcus malanensis TaxID=1706855 RepID=A0ABQ2EKE8_9DEIO|nr:DUF4870 domain-containing protein [Deinococcus malanensis]GGK12638.1 hypothetical protein GCM10008955_02430 [Deinococcus malanensis]